MFMSVCRLKYRIKQIITEDKVTIQKVIDGKEVGTMQTTTLETLMNNWRVHKGKLTEPLPGIAVFSTRNIFQFLF